MAEWRVSWHTTHDKSQRPLQPREAKAQNAVERKGRVCTGSQKRSGRRIRAMAIERKKFKGGMAGVWGGGEQDAVVRERRF